MCISWFVVLPLVLGSLRRTGVEHLVPGTKLFIDLKRKADEANFIMRTSLLESNRLNLKAQFLRASQFLDTEMPTFSLEHLASSFEVGQAVDLLSELQDVEGIDREQLKRIAGEFISEAESLEAVATNAQKNLVELVEEVGSVGRKILEQVEADIKESHRREIEPFVGIDNENAKLRIIEGETLVAQFEGFASLISGHIDECREYIS